MNLVIELVIVNAFLNIIKDLDSGSFKPLKSLAGVVGVDNIEIVVKDHEMSRVVDKMGNELPLNEGTSNRIKAIRVMIGVSAKILNMRRPSIWKLDMRIRGLSWGNVREVAVDLRGILPIRNQHVISGGLILIVPSYGSEP